MKTDINGRVLNVNRRIVQNATACALRESIVIKSDNGLAPNEVTMWPLEPKGSLETLEPKGSLETELRIVTEVNREMLLNFFESLKRKGWMNIRPAYQRRNRWDEKKQSKLIESFLINIPVPPLFVFEYEPARYEVMDGQQRITAIQRFYDGDLKLKGLKLRPDLNGRSYKTVPQKIQDSFDRRSISYTVLLYESAQKPEERELLRKHVFERLNTGGVTLVRQEIRNCLYDSNFNKLCVQLTQLPNFRRVWGLPSYKVDEEELNNEKLRKNSFFSKMFDIEAVLRFFAFRNLDRFSGNIQDFLDRYMSNALKLKAGDLDIMRTQFELTLNCAVSIYGDAAFRVWIPEHSDSKKVKKAQWSSRPSINIWDAVMIGLFQNRDSYDVLPSKAESILERTKELFLSHPTKTFTGAKSTKKDLITKIKLFTELFKA